MGIDLRKLANCSNIMAYKNNEIFSIIYIQPDNNFIEVYPALYRWGRNKFKCKGLKVANIGDEVAVEEYIKELHTRGLNNCGVGLHTFDYMRKIMGAYLDKKYPSGVWKRSDFLILKEIDKLKNNIY